MSSRPEMPVDTTPPPARDVRRVDRIWESFGTEDPYYGVLSDPRYHGEEMSAERRSEFFTSGEAHVANVFATIQRFVDPGFAPARALDFGCGVGRLVLPLARRCGQVTGVDIAPSMLREAAHNAAQAGLANVEFVRSDDALSEVRGEYDLVHSYIVLQHLGVARGLAVIRQLLAHVRPGGVAALHVMYARHGSRLRGLVYRARRDVPGVHALLTRFKGDPVRFGRGLMQMNATPLAPLFEALQRGGFGEVHVEFSNHGDERTDLLGAFLFARRQIEPRW